MPSAALESEEGGFSGLSSGADPGITAFAAPDVEKTTRGGWIRCPLGERTDAEFLLVLFFQKH